MSVLPADYDFQRALQKMTESRSRAFLLLDLSAIVRSHTTLRKHLPKKAVQITFSTRHNTNARFLKLLKRIGVGLRVSTSYDYDVCPPDDDDDDHGDSDDRIKVTSVLVIGLECNRSVTYGVEETFAEKGCTNHIQYTT
mmetsp:Transcript_10812/g.25804  ORF Transcript_10812/g.25804 Transcript_10812/m.25804 type:complete len:139 (+) Transcript_10812:290-706(+)